MATASVAGPPRFLLQQSSLYAANAANTLAVLKEGGQRYATAREALQTQAYYALWSIAAAIQGAQAALQETVEDEKGERADDALGRAVDALAAAQAETSRAVDLAKAGTFGAPFQTAAASASEHLRTAQTALCTAAKPLGAAGALTGTCR